MDELWSGRESAEYIASECALPIRKARAVLDARLAGSPRRGRGYMLYDAALVRALAARPVVAPSVLDGPIFIARVGAAVEDQPRRAFMGVDLTVDDTAAQQEAVRKWWRVSPDRIRSLAPMPFVATVSGFVALGYTITDATLEPEGTALTVEEPGDWFNSIQDKRMPTGRGAPWLITNE